MYSTHKIKFCGLKDSGNEIITSCYNFFTAVEHTLKTVSGIVSGRISDVVNVYEHALLCSFPRARYLVGTDAKFVWIPLNHWMPEWLGDWLLEQLGGKDGPKPAAVLDGRYKKKLTCVYMCISL